MTNVVALPFKGDLIEYLQARFGTLPLLWRDGEAYVPVKPICEALGLDWKSQHRKLTAPDAEAVMVFMTTTGADQKRYEMLCIHVADAMVWLANLTPSRVREDARDALRATRSEVRLLIWNHYRDRLIGEQAAYSDLIAREKVDALHRKPLRARIKACMDLGWDFERIFRSGSASRAKLVGTINDMLRLGLIPAAPADTPFAAALAKDDSQLTLFAER